MSLKNTVSLLVVAFSLIGRVAAVQAAPLVVDMPGANAAERKFHQMVDEGIRLALEGDFEQALGYYEQAQAIRPDRPELKTLGRLIQNQSLDMNYAQTTEFLLQLKEADQWEAIAGVLDRALLLYPDDALLMDYADQASAISQAQGELLEFSRDPQRLSDSAIRDAAKVMLIRTGHAAEHSRSLAQQRESLSAKVRYYETPLPVQVLSDGKTEVIVKRVATVGKTTGRIIELTPGRYTFEGRCPGFKTTLLMVEISQPDTTVHIVCNEPI